MSGRAKNNNLDCGDGFIGSKYFPPDLIETCLSHDPKGIFFGTASTPKTPLSQPQQDALGKILDSRVKGKKLLLCSGGDDHLVPYARSKAVTAVLKDAVTGWYADGRTVVDDRVYDGVGHRFDKDMVEDAVKFLVDAVEDGPRQRSKI